MELVVRAACGAAGMLGGANSLLSGVRGETVWPSGDSSTEHEMSIEFRDRGQHPWSRSVLPLTQVPAETAGVAACVASRTKRATASAEVKRSAKMDALALWERPNQGERFTPCRAWSALRLSA